MSRVVQFLAGVTVVAAASANVECGATTCSSCVGTAPAQVCVTYDAPPAPTCPLTCGGGGGLAPPRCNVATGATTACAICVPLLGSLTPTVGLCVLTNVQVAPYLSANSTINSGLNLNAFAETELVTATVTAGAYTAPAGSAVVILGATPIVTLNANAAATASTNSIFQVNSSLTVNSWNHVGSAKVNNDGAELKVDQLNLAASSKFFVAQEKSTSASAESSLRLGGVNFGTDGTLRVSGGAVHLGGSATVNNNITGTGRLQLSGAASVDGNVPATVTVNVDASGSSAPLVVVNSGLTFNVSGDVTVTRNGESTSSMATDSKATIAVNGIFVAGSASARVQPRVLLNQGGSFVINSAKTFRAEAVEVGAAASVVIERNVDRATLRIERIARCAGTIRIHLTAEAFAAATVSSTSTTATGSVAFSYSNTNNVTELMRCGVEVYDASNRKYTLASRTSAQAAAGRRLLASEGTATWGNDQMTFQMEKQANSAPVSFAVVPLLMVGMAGLLF